MKLDLLKQHTESLIAEFQALIPSFEAVEQRSKSLDQQEYRIRDMQKELEGRQRDIDKIYIDINKEKEYIASSHSDMVLREKKLQIQQIDLTNLKVEKQELDEMRQELIFKEAQLKEKLKAIESHKEKEEELDRRELLIQKEIVIDRERKKLLDGREQRIKVREQSQARYNDLIDVE